MKLTFTLFFIVGTFGLFAQQLVGGEYFFDTDPGVGQATSFTLPAGTDFTGNLNLPVVGLSQGTHQLYVRVQDDLGRWSHYESKSFYYLPVTTPSSAVSNLVGGEYFFDTDPGVGQATSFTLPIGTDYSGNLSLPITGLTEGVHQLYLRVKDEAGKWSHYESKSFYYLEAVASASTVKLVGGEYFFNTDPGVGNGIAFTVPTQETLNNYSLPLDFSGLTDGNHSVYIRVKDSLGKWSHYESKDFYLCGDDLIDVPTASGAITYCQGEKITLTGTPVSGSDQFFWRGPNGYNVQGLGVVRTNATPAMSGVYRFYVVSAGGYHCDTNYVEMDVTVYPSSSRSQTQSICAGTSYSIGNHVYTTSGYYVDTLQTSHGCDSIVYTSLYVLPTYQVTETVKKCLGESYTIGTATYMQSGVYTTVLQSSQGCDSTVVTQLTIGDPVLNTQFTYVDGAITVMEEDATYQWIDCDLGIAIPGAIFQSYTPTEVGHYAVIVTSTLCAGFVDTSACLNVYNVSVSSIDVALGIEIFPNPTASVVTIQSDQSLIRTLLLYDLHGKLITSRSVSTLEEQLSLAELVNGVYLLHVVTDQGRFVCKVMKQD